MSEPTNAGKASSDIEVKPGRKQYSADYKLRILEEIDKAPDGEKGKIRRRENLWSSQIHNWRQQRRNGTLNSGSRGRKPKDRAVVENEELRRENEELKARLAVAEEIMEAQGKVSALLQKMSAKSAK